MDKKKLLIVISAPSGTGKTTICGKLVKSLRKLCFSISATTRAARLGESNGKDYFFITKKEFVKRIKQDFFLEWAKVYGDYYGTPKKYIFDCWQKGNDVILDIDTQGALAVKKKYPESILIFLTPPSFIELKRRLLKRHQDSPKVIKKRLSLAKKEMSYGKKYDYCVVNDKIGQAVKKVYRIITKERNRINLKKEKNDTNRRKS